MGGLRLLAAGLRLRLLAVEGRRLFTAGGLRLLEAGLQLLLAGLRLLTVEGRRLFAAGGLRRGCGAAARGGATAARG